MSGPLGIFGSWCLIAALTAAGPVAAPAEAPATAPATAPTTAPTTAGDAPIRDPSDSPSPGPGPSPDSSPESTPDPTPDLAGESAAPRSPSEAMPAPPAAAVHRPQPPPRRITKATRRGPSGPRYHRAPLDDGFWATVIDEEVLLVLSTGYRVCALITEVTADALAYEDPEGEPRTVARSLVTAVHEASWECDTTSPLPKVEWVLPGTITGSILASAGLVFGVLADTGAISEPSTFAIFAYPAVLFGAPLVGAAGRSAGHDLRVRGIPWARGVGWAAFGGSALSLVFWSVGHLGGVEAFERPGLASAAGGLGFVGAGLLGLDGLRSRAELRALQRHDAEPPSARQSLRLGLTPLVAGGQVHGVGFGISGRLGGG